MNNSLRKTLVAGLRLLGLVAMVKSARHWLINLLPKKLGKFFYANMQKREYQKYTDSYETSKRLCVGRFDDHEKYPYEKYLLFGYQGEYGRALDFGCGMGRMMNRFLSIFQQVDGADLMQENLDYARQYLGCEKQWDSARYNLFKTDGLGCKIDLDYQYDFIFSTICLQHIAVHEIRQDIFRDLCRLLRSGGQACFQMGYGWDNGVHWFDNEYGANATNAGLDVSVPDQSYFSMIEKDLLSAGFSEVKFVIEPSPHPDVVDYHQQWLYIHVWKENLD